MAKICFITAVSSSAHSFLRDHMAALQKEYKVFYICNEPDESKITVVHDGYYCVDIRREISIGKDIKALWSLFKYFRKEQFDVIHSVTPKAGLLSAIAGYFAKIPYRIHIFTGQVWATKTGFKRWLLKLMDKVIVAFDNRFLVDGEGQRQFLIKNGVLKETNSIVLGKGSICGVNLDRFQFDPVIKQNIRSQLNISKDKIAFVFMGRLNHDKGLFELLNAFNKLAFERNNVFLLLLGYDEEQIALHFKEYPNLILERNYLYYGPTNEPQKMLQAGDVFVLPTYREGFGSSVIEASALGLPVICSDAYGVMDAMIDGVTGLRCKVGDVESLYNAMKTMVDNPALIKELGQAGQKRIVHDFDGKIITQYWVEYYNDLLKA